MLAETPVTQRRPCYSAVSASLTTHLPDCSNYLPFCHTHYLILRINTSLKARPFTKPLRWRHTSLLQRFTADLVGNSCREEAEQQPEANGDVPPPLQIVISVPFCLFSLFSLSLSSLCSLCQSSLFSLSSLPHILSTIPSFSSDQFFVLLRYRLQVSFS